jgi:hypothetical protein
MANRKQPYVRGTLHFFMLTKSTLAAEINSITIQKNHDKHKRIERSAE